MLGFNFFLIVRALNWGVGDRNMELKIERAGAGSKFLGTDLWTSVE